jgi:hypothetical protein
MPSIQEWKGPKCYLFYAHYLGVRGPYAYKQDRHKVPPTPKL